MQIIELTVRPIDTDPITFPLTLNDEPFNLASISGFTLYKSGYDGLLQEQVITSGLAIVSGATASGWLQWTHTSGQLDWRYGPYHIWFGCAVSGGGVITVPRDGFFRVSVLPTTF